MEHAPRIKGKNPRRETVREGARVPCVNLAQVFG